MPTGISVLLFEDQISANMDVKAAIKVYCNFKLLWEAPSWGPVPMSCTCKTCLGHGLCADTLLLVSLFDPKVQVPKWLIGATVSNRKKCKLITGAAGRRKMCLI
jgi:hypothetical protein